MKNHEPTDAELRALDKLIATIDVFRVLEPTIPSSYIRLFLQIARSPGKGITEYARELGMIGAVASRIYLEIGPKKRGGGEGLNLVESLPDAIDLRQKHLFLTPKGRHMYANVIRAMGPS